MAAEIIPIQSCCDSLIKYRIAGTFAGWSSGFFSNVGDVCYISGDSNIPDNCYIRISPVTPIPPTYLLDGILTPVTDCDDPLCGTCPVYYTLNDCCTNQPINWPPNNVYGFQGTLYLEFDGNCNEGDFGNVPCPNDLTNLITIEIANEGTGGILSEGCLKLTSVSVAEIPGDADIADWPDIMQVVSTVPTCEECQTCPQPVTTTTTTFFPPQPVPNVPLEPTNECDVITIFPMGVECFTINPTNTETFNGVASLIITGGTPPYEILWETGSIGTTITNLGVGEYSATVTDSYGDFIINTTCELTAPVLPTTTTTSTTTLPQFGDLCMILLGQDSRSNQNKYIDFTFNGYYNGKPSWLAITENLFMYWNIGTTNQWLVSGGTSNTLYNSNPISPPTSGWAFLGPTKALVSVVEGNCNNLPPIGMQISKNDTTCINDGSIIINAYGGTPPYLYSITGGFTTQTSPIFQNLPSGTYSVTVIDSNNLFDTQNVTLTSTAVNTTYVVTLNTTTNNNSKNFTVSVSPTLPVGVTISYDLVYQTEFKVAPNPSVATQTVTPTINVNGSPITNPSPITTNSTLFNPCNSGVFSITNRVYTWSNINMITTTTVSGSISDVVTPISIVTCYTGTKIRNLTINNLKIDGCDCCSVLLQQTGGQTQSGSITFS